MIQSTEEKQQKMFVEIMNNLVFHPQHGRIKEKPWEVLSYGSYRKNYEL